MRSYDLAPLTRSAVGFDRLFTMLEAASKTDGQGYPPYNIESLAENQYRIELAVAGFAPEDLTIEAKENVLIVTGRKAANDGGDDRRFLHRGLAERDFERRFQLADYVVATEAGLANGLLRIGLERRLPEALKARTIPIATSKDALIEARPTAKKAKKAKSA